MPSIKSEHPEITRLVTSLGVPRTHWCVIKTGQMFRAIMSKSISSVLATRPNRTKPSDGCMFSRLHRHNINNNATCILRLVCLTFFNGIVFRVPVLLFVGGWVTINFSDLTPEHRKSRCWSVLVIPSCRAISVV